MMVCKRLLVLSAYKPCLRRGSGTRCLSIDQKYHSESDAVMRNVVVLVIDTILEFGTRK